MTNFTLVTAAPPTPNGDLHLGHLSGPYSGADIHIRAVRLLGGDGLFVTGSDIHQSYVPTKAAREGAQPLEMANGFADEIASIFASANFLPDAVVRPQHSELHRTVVRDFFAQLHANGALRVREEPALFCDPCERYLFEAHVTGKCPHCGSGSDGNACENCALPNTVVDLVNPVCNACGGTPEERPVQRLVFPLSEYADRLRDFLNKAAISPQLEALCTSMIENGLPDIPVSHPTDWGIPMPVPGFEDHCIYVWAEMMPGYFAELAEGLAATGRDPQDWPSVWNAPDTEIVQFYGFDNGYFHALLQPALLMAYDPGFRLPTAMVTNEFYLLGDSKFSTSRRHAIWANDLLAEVPSDITRFVLALDRPETARTSFSWERFHELADGELAGTWQGWLSSLLDRVAMRADDAVPHSAPLTGSQHRFITLLHQIAVDCHQAYATKSFSPRRAARTLCELVRCALDFSAGQQRATGAAADAALVAELTAARVLAQLSYPLMPEFAQRLWTALGEAGVPRWDGVKAPAPGRPVDTSFRGFAPLPASVEQTVMSR
ncbi:methionine--tRNA ligase [Streptomyces sp. NPDC001339]|uniref:methionine--tRNA ligase n=1 Tax=Streptomyces sp. NPDC001339 TaxID=3364563 RepID=UPI0036A55811